MHMCITSLQRARPVISAPASALAPLAALGIPRLLRGLALVVLVAESLQCVVIVDIPTERVVDFGGGARATDAALGHVLASEPAPAENPLADPRPVRRQLLPAVRLPPIRLSHGD